MSTSCTPVSQVFTPGTTSPQRNRSWSLDTSPENDIIEGISLFNRSSKLKLPFPFPKETMYIVNQTSKGNFCFTEVPEGVIKLDDYKPKSMDELSTLTDMILVCLKYQWPHVVDMHELGKSNFVLWGDRVFITQQRLVFSKETKGCLKIVKKFASCILRMYLELLPSDCKSVADLAIRFFWSLNTERFYNAWESKVWWYIFPRMTPNDFSWFSRSLECEKLDPTNDILCMRRYLRVYTSYFPEGESYESDDEGIIEFDLDKYTAFKKQVSLKEWSNFEFGDRNNSAFHKFVPPYFDVVKRCQMFSFQDNYLHGERNKEERIRFHEILRELIVFVDPQVDRMSQERIFCSLLEDFGGHI